MSHTDLQDLYSIESSVTANQVIDRLPDQGCYQPKSNESLCNGPFLVSVLIKQLKR